MKDLHLIRLCVLLALGCAHCATSAATTGQRYLARGQTALGLEYLQLAVAAAPQDDDVRAKALLAVATQGHELNTEIQALTDAGQSVRALQRLAVLEDSADAAAKLQLGPDKPSSYASQSRSLVDMATKQMQSDLDARLARGLPQKQDLNACNTLQSMNPDDSDVQRSCTRLLGAFKHLAAVRAGPGVLTLPPTYLARVAQSILTQHPELLAVVADGDASQNAVLEVAVLDVKPTFSDWTLQNRDAYHAWVPRRDERGREVLEEVTVVEGGVEKRTMKKVWDEVSGEYRTYHRHRDASVTYRATLLDQRTGVFSTAAEDTMTVTSEARFQTYAGDPRARRAPEPNMPMRPEDTPPLLTDAQLLAQALQQSADKVGVLVSANVD